MRVLVGVRYAFGRTTPAVDTVGENASSIRSPVSSRPATPTRRTRPPSLATLLAALPAPPGTIWVASYSRMRTGASRDTRPSCP